MTLPLGNLTLGQRSFEGASLVQYFNSSLRAVGRGPPILTIHGGPGFAQDYLMSALGFLASDYTLVSYDQLRSETKTGVALSDLARQLVLIVDYFKRSGLPPLLIIAHSWGGLVLAAAAATDRKLMHAQILGGLIVNPVPLSRPRYDQSVKCFLKKIPLRRQIEIRAKAALGFDGASIMRLLWPYYLKPKSNSASMSFDFPFDLATYVSVSRSLGNFDYTTELAFMARFELLLSRHDATSTDMIAEWVTACPKFEFIDYAGHFPMLENPAYWKRSIRSRFSEGCPCGTFNC